MFDVKKGASRTVICTKRFAFKFPTTRSYTSFLYGLIANVCEGNNYRYAVKWDIFPKEKLCPVVFRFPMGLMNVMRKAHPLNEKQFQNLNFDSFVYINKNAIIPVEHKVDSFGVLDGKIVAVDYA